MTEKQKEKYFKKVYDNIAEYGFHKTYVMEEIGFTPFGYSTGIYKNFGIPELFISGLPNGLTNTLINNYAERFKFNEIPLNKKIDDLIDRFPVYFIEVKNDKLTEYTLSSFKYYENSEFKYLQLIFPDLNGFFPNEAEYDYDQEILGR
ncbi:hypothetical protein BTO05_00985 [Winogradskyella sp. PC-19]|uniref:DUF4262 domain-containing protein n=1 Tax=Winogradskyella sp. PC-19 TaxID=754417 RepID=UPI000B3CAD73|nr:DUF4262 domain-containing protein [Winogradskyella sp. PC-19]ARV08281.1 hypothetical protein BTO05_00985 [Winogradskyella sp. PC-19]RZN74415.1 MAG: DUF4262 domain-containing protein [Winogradskyella sp.]